MTCACVGNAYLEHLLYACGLRMLRDIVQSGIERVQVESKEGMEDKVQNI